MRGLGNRLKRKAIFNYLKHKQLDVIFLQEVHCVKSKIALWQTEWGSRWYASSGDTLSRGTAILFRPGSKVEMVKTVVDHDGRNVIVNIKVNQTEITLCNLYAPNHDTPQFFKSVFKTLDKVVTENIVIGGDFNLTLDPFKDRHNSKTNNNRAAETVLQYMEDNTMVDIWRMRNENDQRYTWFKRSNGQNPLSASRIDFFLVSAGLATQIDNTEITSSTCTDHSLISVQLHCNDIARGPRVWKFNNQLLNNQEFCKEIEMLIESTLKTCIKAKMSFIDTWEYLKKECRNFCNHSQKRCK